MLDYLEPRPSSEIPPDEGLAGLGAVSFAAVAVIACQIIAVAAGEQTGAIFNASLVAVLAAAASFQRAAESARAAYVVLSLLPCLALARLVMPQNSIRSDLWELVIAAPIVAGSVLFMLTVNQGIRRTARRSPSVGWQLAIASLGAPAGLLAFGLAQALGDQQDVSTGVVMALVLFVAGAVDELLFRGVLQRSLEPIYGQNAFIIAALLYTAMLLGSSAVTVVLGGFLGLIFGFLVIRTNALLTVALAHGLLNVVWLAVAPGVF
jgi:membrane protease YdiL (CAAX protease family)